MNESRAISSLRLWQLISPALPVGAYAYSQGLEYAVESHWVHDEKSASRWILGNLRHNFACLDLPILKRLIQAWNAGDGERIEYWNRYLLCSRETRELRGEDGQMGAALQRLLLELGLSKADRWSQAEVGFACMFALAASAWKIEEPEAARGYAWAWCENQVTAAIKLIPLGQSAGQRILFAASGAIVDAVSQSRKMADEDLGVLSTGLAIASSRHEMQYTRLFRS
uniref:Urease accessory protein UreF n=1 Tax=Candidatus Kentrum sp. FW TaxID=2126338 RepID=A0A450T3H7_9GAMM|nr:MAG: urease accessory protein [Candidatus Kentron sp. FW]VFJ61055.1 MAG: urease accessory protein [Candidatus Kentron sp. FW]